MGFNSFICREISSKDMSITDLSKQSGVNRGTLSSIVNKGVIPSFENASKIATALGVSLDYLATGKEPTPALAPTSNDTVAVPFYGNVPISAGGGAVVLDEGITEYLPIDKEWVASKIGISTKLTAFPVVGDSMYPTYKTGDTVICVDVKDDYMGDGIYIVSLDGVVMIKRLNRTPQGIMHIISDNPLNKDYEININEENLNFKIIAMVKMTLALN